MTTAYLNQPVRTQEQATADMLAARCLSVMWLDTPDYDLPGWYVVRDAETDNPSIKAGPYQTDESATNAALREHRPALNINILKSAGGLRRVL